MLQEGSFEIDNTRYVITPVLDSLADVMDKLSRRGMTNQGVLHHVQKMDDTLGEVVWTCVGIIML